MGFRVVPCLGFFPLYFVCSKNPVSYGKSAFFMGFSLVEAGVYRADKQTIDRQRFYSVLSRHSIMLSSREFLIDFARVQHMLFAFFVCFVTLSLLPNMFCRLCIRSKVESSRYLHHGLGSNKKAFNVDMSLVPQTVRYCCGVLTSAVRLLHRSRIRCSGVWALLQHVVMPRIAQFLTACRALSRGLSCCHRLV